MYYYYTKGGKIELVIFNKYMIDTTGVIKNKKNGDILKTSKNKAGYNVCGAYDDVGKRRVVYIGRALASLRGPPPTPNHTADHIDRQRSNDTLENIRWATRKEQNDNQDRLDTFKSAFVIIKDGCDNTAKGWAEHLKGQKNTFGRDYTEGMVTKYAQNKQYGFSYKQYPDSPGEIWKEITGSENNRGRWEISNMNRVKYITKYAENVLENERLGLRNGYPIISFGYCHVLSFKSFFPNIWAMKKPEEVVKHIGDNKLDFRPHMLQIGTHSENGTEAHDNGSYDGAKTVRTKCVSYINGVLEKEHASTHDAMRYLISKGFEKAAARGIGMALSEERKTAYKRTWELRT
jgi:hypothetical protein